MKTEIEWCDDGEEDEGYEITYYENDSKSTSAIYKPIRAVCSKIERSIIELINEPEEFQKKEFKAKHSAFNLLFLQASIIACMLLPPCEARKPRLSISAPRSKKKRCAAMRDTPK